MSNASGEGHKGGPWLAGAIVVLVVAASASLLLLMKQASRPAELDGDGSASGVQDSVVQPGRDAPTLPPAHRKLGEMPVVSEDRVILNSLVAAAKSCLDLGGTNATPSLGASAGYLGVLLEVEPTGRPVRAAPTSFTGAPIAQQQSACLSAALLKLQFARSSATRLLQRRYYLGGGAPPVEPPLPEQISSADLASALSALGDVGALCPSLSKQSPAAVEGWRAQVVLGPEGEVAWRWSEPAVDPDAASCLNDHLARLRLPPTQTASSVALRLACAADRCSLTGAISQTAEIVE